MTDRATSATWHKVLTSDELEEGRVRSVSVGPKTLCMTHYDGQYGALDNHCPHQGGPLGEGSIENGHLRCPWHGWDYCPLTGNAPGYPDGVEAFPVEVREDGIYVSLPDEQPAPRTVSDVMMETMVNWGVRWVFGMVGHSNLGVAEAVRQQAEQKRLSYIGVRHEGAASFAASAYGKLTGRPAACLAIAGPGATNLLTGLWDAHVDRSPALALCGQVETQVLGPGAFQELDLAAAFGDVAVWSQSVLPSSRHAELMNLAVKKSIINRGVTQLVFPDEVASLPADESAAAGSPAGRMGHAAVSPAEESLEAAVTMLQSAERPVIVVGHGARFHMTDILALADTLTAPVLTTFKGKGLISDDHPLACGVLGRSGTPIASWFMNEADCILVLGASFSNHTGITTKKQLIQVDLDREALGRFHAIDVPIWGDLQLTAQALTSRLSSGTKSVDQRPEIAARWKIWREEKQRREQDHQGRGLNSATVFRELTQAVDDDAILAVDVGNNTYSFGRYFECRQQAVLMSGYLGSIGFSFPAAMGAWAATQEPESPFSNRQVVSVSGDGGFGQYLAEVTTAVKYNMNITHVLLNNNELGKISKEQRSGGWDVWETSLSNPDFAEYARSCGAMGIRVSTPEELPDALSKALAHPGPALVAIDTDVELV